MSAADFLFGGAMFFGAVALACETAMLIRAIQSTRRKRPRRRITGDKWPWA